MRSPILHLLPSLCVLLAACAAGPQRLQAPGGVPVRARYEGRHALAPELLDRAIRRHLERLSRDPKDRPEGLAAARALEDLYRAFGYSEVAVRFVEVGPRDPRGARRVVFQIDEGPRLLLERVTLAGGPADLRAGLLAGTPFTGVHLPRPFVRKEIDRLREVLGERLRAQGYFEARVGAPAIRAEGGRVTVRFDLEPGPLYTLGRVELAEGLERALAGAARPEPPATGKPFSLEEVGRWIEELRRVLRELGHPRPSLEPTLAGSRKRREVFVEVLGDPGPRVEIADVVVRGQHRLFAGDLLARSRLVPGRRYRGSDEDATLRALLALPEVAAVRVEPQEIAPGRARFVLEVEEDERSRFSIAPYYRTYEGYGADVAWLERRLLGPDFELEIRTGGDRKGWRTGLALRAFRPLHLPARLELALDFGRRERPTYAEKAAGLELALEAPLARGLDARLMWRFTRAFHTGPDIGEPVPRSFDEGRAGATLSYDGRDRPVFARRGTRAHLTASLASPALGGSQLYGAAGVSAETHLPLGPARLSLGFSTDLLFAGRGSRRLPVQRRLYLGGAASLMAFREDRGGPRTPAGDPTGGEYRNLAQLGLAFPLVADPAPPAGGALPPPQEIGFRLFGQAGNLGRRVEDFGLDALDYALGLGLYTIAPNSTLRLDFAFHPNRRPGEEEWLIFFELGPEAPAAPRR